MGEPMLTCREAAEKANDYLDGTLGLWPRMNLRLHLVFCRYCRSFVGQMQTTIRFIDKHGYTLMPEEQPPRHLVEAFREHARRNTALPPAPGDRNARGRP